MSVTWRKENDYLATSGVGATPVEVSLVKQLKQWRRSLELTELVVGVAHPSNVVSKATLTVKGWTVPLTASSGTELLEIPALPKPSPLHHRNLHFFALGLFLLDRRG